MFRGSSPVSILEAQVSELLTFQPRLREGEEPAIHDARVATRRIRAALPLVRPQFTSNEFDDVSRIVRKTGRALGEVRDYDIMHRLLTELANRLPVAAATTAPVRSDVQHDRVRAVRRLIKVLDRMDLGSLRERIGRRGFGGRLRSRGAPPRWRASLRAIVAWHAADLRTALDRSGGVYFPNRSHSVRLAAKKLRYAMEMADTTGLWRVPSALRHLKRAQDALGAVHDRQLLIDRLTRTGESPAASQELATLRRLLEAEIEERHQKYVALRHQLVAICDAARRTPSGSYARAWLAAGVVVPSLVILSRRSDSADHLEVSPCESDVRIRVLMP